MPPCVSLTCEEATMPSSERVIEITSSETPRTSSGLAERLSWVLRSTFRSSVPGAILAVASVVKG